MGDSDVILCTIDAAAMLEV